jgi:TPR repeat protein
MNKSLVLLRIILFLSFFSLVGADFDEGFSAYLMGNYEKAYKEFKASAEQGNAAAQYNLGQMHYKGKGVTQSYPEAAKWFRRAANQGDAAAQFNLGEMCFEGKGMKRDVVQAYMWLNLAAEQGDLIAKEDRDIIAGKMKSAQIAEARHLAKEWKPKAENESVNDKNRVRHVPF